MADSAIHQCPHCELRFLFANELEDHLAVDHAPTPSTRAPVPGSPASPADQREA